MVLEENYRSTQPTLDLANAVLEDMAEGGHAKRLWGRFSAGGGRRPPLAPCHDEAAPADARGATRILKCTRTAWPCATRRC